MQRIDYALFMTHKPKLLAFFPRGRVREHEDGQAVLRARSKAYSGDFVYLHGDHVALYTERHYEHWFEKTKLWHTGRPIPCETEGVIFLRPAKGLEEALGIFMKRDLDAPRPRGFMKKSHDSGGQQGPEVSGVEPNQAASGVVGLG